MADFPDFPDALYRRLNDGLDVENTRVYMHQARLLLMTSISEGASAEHIIASLLYTVDNLLNDIDALEASAPDTIEGLDG